ncbi:MAG: lysophospholipid acyltransferase family protein [Spirochaetota bacterium]
MKRLRTMISWTGGALVFVAIAAVIVVCPGLCRRSHWESQLKRLCRTLVHVFGYQVRVSGTAQLPQTGGYVLVCNHVNLMDAFLLFGYLPGSFRGLEQLQHFSWPVYGALTRRFGNIALDQSGGGRTAEALMTAGSALKDGISLVMFPEGHRTRDGRLGPFMRGAFRLAARTDAVLVPVVQRGAWDIFHKGAREVSPGLVDLIVLAPWTADCRAGLDDTTFCARVRQEMDTSFNQNPGPGPDCPDCPDALSST